MPRGILSPTPLRIDYVFERLLTAAEAMVRHDVANLGRPGWEFFRCYTYPHGEMPSEVTELMAAIAAAKGGT